MSYLASSFRRISRRTPLTRHFFPPLTGAVNRNFRTSPCCPKIFLDIVNNEEFKDKVMSSKIPVVVDFHADWCEPCKILTPRLKELIEPKENINLAIINVEDFPELVHTFEVKAVPAVLAIKDGLVIDKFIGLVDSDMIEKLISKLEE